MRINRSMPASALIPVLAYDDVEAATAFLTAAFGFQVRLRIGRHRAQLEYEGAGLVIVQRASPQPIADGASELMVRVADADRHCETARANGARVLAPPSDFPYGERQYAAEDIAGHRWVFSQSIADVDPAEWGGEPV